MLQGYHRWHPAKPHGCAGGCALAVRVITLPPRKTVTSIGSFGCASVIFWRMTVRALGWDREIPRTARMLSPPTTRSSSPMLARVVPAFKPRRSAGEPAATRCTRRPTPGGGRLNTCAISPESMKPPRPLQNDFCSRSWRATLEVTANPSPSEPPEWDRMWLTIPMTSPCMLNSGPPELPWLIAASVWKNSARDIPLKVAFGLRRALMYPTVRVWLAPRGGPTTNTGAPISTASESPMLATNGARGAFSSCRSATSAEGSDDRTLALSVSPVRNSTSIASAVCTPWAAVRILPSGEMSTPEPRPPTLTGWPIGTTGRSVSFVWISTTVGSTRLKTSARVWVVWACACHRPAQINMMAIGANERAVIPGASSGSGGERGGEGGIRTHGEVSPTHAFQACSFSHSDTSPREACVLADGIGGEDRPPRGWSQRGAGRATSGRGQITTKALLFIPR